MAVPYMVLLVNFGGYSHNLYRLYFSKYKKKGNSYLCGECCNLGSSEIVPLVITSPTWCLRNQKYH